jgi:sucrose synthase
MHELVQAVLNSDEKTALHQVIDALTTSEKRYFLRTEILQAFADYCHHAQKPAYFFHASSIGELMHHTHEMIFQEGETWFVLRPWIGSQQIWRLSADFSQFDQMSPEALLDVRDRFVDRAQSRILELDLRPFYKDSPTIRDPRNIGQGLAFLNHYLCDELLNDSSYWLEALFNVLHLSRYDSVKLLINNQIHSGQEMAEQVKQALRFLKLRSNDEPYSEVHEHLKELGFEPGWGNTAGRASETLELLDRLITSPEPAILEAFVSRIPATFRVVLVSIHGWIGQESVLGRPETTGQVAYVLDQARSLENKLQEDIQLAGLDLLNIQPQVLILTRLIPNCEGTQCGVRLEKVDDTENAWILRVPFREFNPKVTQNWISRYEIWGYLETFAIDAEAAILKQLGASPNLIIGNYSDGNLVAFLLSRRLKSIYCTIAHSLEKPKRLFSNLYWQDLEDQYHFSAQFTADLISMNAADFIVTSSYQEIVGTPEAMGQYESYKCFTMPQLYHAVDGIDLFSPKFNRVPPGVNEKFFFPYSQADDRDSELQNRIYNLLFTRQDSTTIGSLADPNKRPILALAPMTPIKNLAGLAECFGKSQELQNHCNLILVTNNLDLGQATSFAVAEEIKKLHAILDEYHLHDRVRVIGMSFTCIELGEIYREIADRRGVYVQPAHFEAFGRTILEAMISGLPTFATQFGGALEIIHDKENGFHINPANPEEMAEEILNFVKQCETDLHYWQTISERAIKRVQEQYNWKLHTQQLLLLAKTYGFWSYVSRDDREALLRYLDALFYLLYKPRADLILEAHMQR